jgi:aryl-alcohol dehydrogenase-like predicted oxidoreductase
LEFRVLGKTNLRVSALSIGSWQISGPLILEGRADGFPDPGRRQVIDLIRSCEELGLNLIDTAELYGDGEGERRIGEAVRGRRDRWILATKFGMRKGASGQRIVDSHPRVIRPSLESSLRRLQTDHVEIYLYHSPPDTSTIPEARDTLEVLKKEGKICFYGISTNDPGVLRQLVNHNAVDVVLLSQSLLTHPHELLKIARKHNLGVMIRGALERGRLSGKYFRVKPEFSEEDIRKRDYRQVDFSRYCAYERILPPDVSMSDLALRYLMDFDTTHTIVLGGRSVEQYRSAARALSLSPLAPRTRRELGRLRSRLSGSSRSSEFLHRIYRNVMRILSRA